MSSAPCGVQPPPPTIASGRSDAVSNSRMRARASGAGPRCRAHHGRRVGRVGRLHQHVLGQREHDRPGPPAEGRLEGTGNELGNALRPVDLEHPLGQAAEHLLVVDLLEALAAAMLARHLPDQQHEWRRVLHRRVHTGGGMRRARARA